jgi:hypothetical protein
MGALTPGPEDAEKQYNGADNLANSTHSPKTIPVAHVASAMALRATLECHLPRQTPGVSHPDVSVAAILAAVAAVG